MTLFMKVQVQDRLNQEAFMIEECRVMKHTLVDMVKDQEHYLLVLEKIGK